MLRLIYICVCVCVRARISLYIGVYIPYPIYALPRHERNTVNIARVDSSDIEYNEKKKKAHPYGEEPSESVCVREREKTGGNFGS